MVDKRVETRKGATYSISGGMNNSIRLFDGFESVATILASTDPYLGLPLLPAINNIRKEAVKKSAKAWMSIPTEVKINAEGVDYTVGYVEGYEEAVSTKKYSEEDMKKCFFRANNLRYELRNKKTSIEEEFDDYMKSLNPKPIAVEVEMRYETWYEGTKKLTNIHNFVLKVDENNTVIVKRWIYE